MLPRPNGWRPVRVVITPAGSRQAEFDERGLGWWALEARETGEFIGRVGLDEVDEDMPYAGLDIGWRLTRSAWGHGYATEAALACLVFGFEALRLPEVLASTTVNNLRSQAVMRRIGMTRDPADDFEDPSVPEGLLRQCVLYRTTTRKVPTGFTKRRDTTPAG